MTNIIINLNSYIKKNTEIEIPLGKITIGKQIGQGGTSIVRNISFDGLSKDFVIKFLLENISKKESEKYFRFKQAYLNLLSLPNNNFIIPQIYFGNLVIDKSLTVPYIIMHKAEKGKLEEAVNFKDFQKKFDDILNAIDFIHQNRIIHRDLKPQNIFFYNNRYVLGDFDISKFLNLEYIQLVETTKGDRIGNFSYSAPEQFKGQPCYESDWYAFGHILYWLITGDNVRGQDDINFSKYGEKYIPYQKLIRKLISHKVEDRLENKDQILNFLKKFDEEKEGIDFCVEQEKRAIIKQNILEIFDNIIYKYASEIAEGYKILEGKRDMKLFLSDISSFISSSQGMIWWKKRLGDCPIKKVIGINNFFDKYFTKNNYYLVDNLEINIDKIYLYNGGDLGTNFFILESKKQEGTGLYSNNKSDSEEYGLYSNKYKVTRSEFDNGYALINKKRVDIAGKTELRDRHLKKDLFFIGPRGLFFNKREGGINENIINTFFDLYYQNNKYITKEMFNVFKNWDFRRYKPYDIY